MVGNTEVWANLKDWEQSIRKEYDQLVTQKCAVRQITKDQLQRMSSDMKLPIELLPAKMVHTRKALSGAYRSRAVVCGNYAGPDESEHYAGGVDGNQIRTMLRLGALKSWSAACTDIRTAFLNAPHRDETRLMAMEIPVVFKKLGLAGSDEVWLIDKAIYGLTTSPRDWSLHRDEVLPTIKWQRHRHGRAVNGIFKKTPDENIWRIEEVDQETNETVWTGLMSVYVDDLLLMAEEETLEAATKAIAGVWVISDVEKAEENKAIKYCGFEIEVAANNDGYIVSQRMYEQEMIQRFGIEKSIDYPKFQLAEGDDEPTEAISAGDVKTAQSMAGALLWLSTRTRPDVAMAVATACRLCTKNPCKSIEVSNAVMQYIRGHQGGLHYPQGVPAETWGKRNQLKIERHCKLLEVFSDISFGAGSRHRSLQGLLVYFAGAPIAWQSSQQAFVTYSTAESELVAYCEALNAGRSMEAMLCSMVNEPTGQNSFERVIYGDNAAAIAMAHGTGTSNWRTRHLRVRSSYLKEALDGIAPGGLWRLLHLRGTELVADGLTKPLLGQSYSRFVQDLGMNREEPPEINVEAQAAGGGGHGQAAMRAMVLGSLLLSRASGSAADENEEEETNWVFTTGAVLMALGAIYSGQLLFEASRCCLRRLRQLSETEKDPIRSHKKNQRDQEGMTSMEEEYDYRSDGETMCLSSRSRSGLACGEGASMSLNLPSRSGSAANGGASMSLSSTSRSGSAFGEGASTSLNLPSRSGSLASAGAPTSRGLSSQSGSATKAGASSALKSSSRSGTGSDRGALGKGDGTSVTSKMGPTSAAGSTMSMNLTRSSGSSSAGDSPMSLRRRSRSGTGLENAAGNPAVVADFVAASESVNGTLVGGSVGEVSVGSQGQEIQNPWNKFQHQHRGLGMTSTALAKMHKGRMSKDSP